jgi:hypothetical protein
MAQYQSIYRKWRPQSFEDIVGQNHITQTLKNAIKMNRIGHAYLYAANRLEVAIDGLKVNIEGEMVPGGWMDENNGKRTGFKNVRFEVEVKTNHSREEIEKVHNLALKASPMYDNFINPIKVTDSFLII